MLSLLQGHNFRVLRQATRVNLLHNLLRVKLVRNQQVSIKRLHVGVLGLFMVNKPVLSVIRVRVNRLVRGILLLTSTFLRVHTVLNVKLSKGLNRVTNINNATFRHLKGVTVMQERINKIRFQRLHTNVHRLRRHKRNLNRVIRMPLMFHAIPLRHLMLLLSILIFLRNLRNDRLITILLRNLRLLLTLIVDKK